MNRQQLQYFALAYPTGNFSVAAARVPMTPQGLAKAIHALEVSLGVPLFAADASGARVPTPYAHELIGFAESLAERYDRLQEAFDRIRAQERHQIRLGASLGVAGLLGPGFLNEFHQAHPDIAVTVTEEIDAACDEGLRRGRYDLALTLAPYAADFITRELYATRICYWVHRDDPLSAKAALTIEDLDGRSIAIPGPGFKVFECLQAQCAERGVTPREYISSQELFWIYQFVMDGRGLGFTLEPIAELPFYVQGDSVVAIPLEGCVWRFGLSFVRSRVLTAAEQSLYEHCVAYVKRIRRSI